MHLAETLVAVTMNAAEVMGIADKVARSRSGSRGRCSSRRGRRSDMTSNIDHAYIQGHELNMMDIQK